MATAPRRETLIALHARRTAHQVASAVYLHQHSRQLLQKCPDCGQEFLPERPGQTGCGSCLHISFGPLAYERPLVVPPRRPMNWRPIIRATSLLLAATAILFAFMALIYAGMKLDLARAFGL